MIQEFKIENIKIEYEVIKDTLHMRGVWLDSPTFGKVSLWSVDRNFLNAVYLAAVEHERQQNPRMVLFQDYQILTNGNVRFLYDRIPLLEDEPNQEIQVPIQEVEAWLDKEGYMSGEDFSGDSPGNLRFYSWGFKDLYEWEAEYGGSVFAVLEEFFNFKIQKNETK